MECMTPNLIGKPGQPQWVRCLKCLPCRLWTTGCWELRLAMETRTSLLNCALTLTYDDTHILTASNNSLADAQAFLKRLRKNTSARFRYYLKGEHGSKSGRWHYHMIVSGWAPPALISRLGLLSRSGSPNTQGLNLWLPEWPVGGIYADEVTPATVRYVLGYLDDDRKTGPQVRSQSNGIGKAGLMKIGLDASLGGQEWSSPPSTVTYFGRTYPVNRNIQTWLTTGYDAGRSTMGKLPLSHSMDFALAKKLSRIISNTLRDDPDIQARKLDNLLRLSERVQSISLTPRKD
jgi:hypothetical protein